MKKTIIMIILAIGVGFTFGFLFLKKFNTETITEVSNIKSQVYAFQIGVYKNKDNALNAANTNKGIVILDNDIYRVYIAILKDETVEPKFKNYYTVLARLDYQIETALNNGDLASQLFNIQLNINKQIQ